MSNPKNDYKLSLNDQAQIKDWESHFGQALDSLEKAKQFSIGDYLILLEGSRLPGTSLMPQKNSYGAPIKYKVVFINRYGVPFVKAVNKKGNPCGELYSCVGDNSVSDEERFEFTLDPDFADALLLEDTYDPAILHRTKQEIFKEVTKHNKKVKLKTREIGDVVNLFANAKVGDTLWTSTKGHYTIQDKETVSKADFHKKVSPISSTYYNGTRVKGPFVVILTVVDKKGKTHRVSPDFFLDKALYSERPRSYKELKI